MQSRHKKKIKYDINNTLKDIKGCKYEYYIPINTLYVSFLHVRDDDDIVKIFKLIEYYVHKKGVSSVYIRVSRSYTLDFSVLPYYTVEIGKGWELKSAQIVENGSQRVNCPDGQYIDGYKPETSYVKHVLSKNKKKRMDGKVINGCVKEVVEKLNL